MHIFNRFTINFFFLSFIRQIFSLKLLNATELSACSNTPWPEKNDDCLKLNFTEIVCCYYQMTFPLKNNFCYGASLSSKGLKSTDSKIILSPNVWVIGSLDCSSNFFQISKMFEHFMLYLIILLFII